MPVTPQPEERKEAVSPMPGKPTTGRSLIQQVFIGDSANLFEAIDLLKHEDAAVRTGAARLIEQTAAIYPKRVAPWIAEMLPALDAPEAQTRWTILHVLGLCAAQNSAAALQALPKAQQFISERSGMTLWNATIVFLGYVGVTSAENARQALPLLSQALTEIPILTKAILESCLRLINVADDDSLAEIARMTEAYAHSDLPGVRAVVAKIQNHLLIRQQNGL